MPQRAAPPIDVTQNVQDVSGTAQNGWTTITFSRALDTGDMADDFIFDGQSCAYFLYAWGGSVSANGNINYHINREISTVQYCFNSCNAANQTAQTSGPITRAVGFSFSIAITWNPLYSDTTSGAYLSLKNQVLQLVIIFCEIFTKKGKITMFVPPD